MANKRLCFKCRKYSGYKRRDCGSPIAMMMICNGCHEKKPILSGSHWELINE